MKRLILVTIVLISELMITPWMAVAAVPQAVPYQGQLSDAVGVPVNGAVNITFKLYTVASGGVPIWTEVHTGSNVAKGLFNVNLGSVNPFPAATFSTPVYLGVKVGADPEMTPRTALTSAPFALHADDADTVGGFSSSQLDQSAHVSATNNPHGVTAAQVGAEAAGAAAAVQTNLSAHTGNTANPHAVTAAQVGADVAGAAAAVQTNLSAHTGSTANPHAVTAAQTGAVAVAGDTMTGTLNLLANGLVAGTSQLVLSGGKVGIGTATPLGPLDVTGNINVDASTDFIDNNGDGMIDEVGEFKVISGNRLFVDPSGRIGFGTSTPTAKLDIVGGVAGSQLNISGGGMLVTGTGPVWNGFTVKYDPGVAGAIPATGAGVRMMWYPEMAAFRAGIVSGAQWDQANIGAFSVAMGRNTTASGSHSTAMGRNTTASGSHSTAMGASTTASGSHSTAMGDSTTASGSGSTAMGRNTTASGLFSTAMGDSTTASAFYSTAMGLSTTASGLSSTAMGLSTTASGYHSTAMGDSTTASGYHSTAMGTSTTAKSRDETVIGQHNTAYTMTTNGAATWAATDRLFTIGNGTSTAARSDAMVVLKNGNTGIGESAPSATLHVKGGNWNVAGGSGDLKIGNALGLLNIGVATSGGGAGDVRIYAQGGTQRLLFGSGTTDMMTVQTGKVGIGTIVPTAMLSVNGTANKPGGGTWAVFSDERLKDIKGDFTSGLDRIMQLQPIVYHYKKDNALKLPFDSEYYGFSAQALQKVIPEAVDMSSAGFLEVNSDPVIWTMLNAIKELKQQKDAEMAALKAEKDGQIAALKARNIALQVRMDSLDSKVEMLVRAMTSRDVATIQKTDSNERLK